MPELPDVEAFKRYLNATSLHKTIGRVKVYAPDVLEGVSGRRLRNALEGKSLDQTRRHGKYLFARISGGGWLVMHFGMTGRLKYFKGTHSPPRHTRLLLSFENGFNLAYILQRKLGRVFLAGSGGSFIKERGLGPDAMTIGRAPFLQRLGKGRGGVKPWLMNQGNIAGIGNIYSDEILFQARVHPLRKTGSLDETAGKRLFRKTRSVLKTASDAGADPEAMPRSWLMRHRKGGGRCPRCSSPLATLKAAGRTSWFCPECQPARPTDQ
ncbi:MAG: Fpg/Nei family DNA glycosylase [Candidatus Nitrospinota bacterium M3_3B_026]